MPIGQAWCQSVTSNPSSGRRIKVILCSLVLGQTRLQEQRGRREEEQRKRKDRGIEVGKEGKESGGREREKEGWREGKPLLVTVVRMWPVLRRVYCLTFMF